jgi:hypothetical protein
MGAGMVGAGAGSMIRTREGLYATSRPMVKTNRDTKYVQDNLKTIKVLGQLICIRGNSTTTKATLNNLGKVAQCLRAPTRAIIRI